MTRISFSPSTAWFLDEFGAVLVEELGHRARGTAGDLLEGVGRGKLDRTGATIKEKFEGAKDKVEEVVDKAKDKLNENR